MQEQSSEFHARLEETLDLNGLSADLATEIEGRLTRVTYEKGAVIFLRGSPADFFFWLIKGFVKLYLPHHDGTRTLIDLARPGDLMGFVNATNSIGRAQLFEAQALTKCSVGLLTREHLMQLLAKLDHQAAVHALEQLNTAWSVIFERYVSFIGSSFRTRLELVLKSLGTRFGIEDKRGTLLTPELCHEDLAEMIGSSRPMVSKLIGDLIDEGFLVRGEKRRFILRTKGLPSTVAPNARKSPVSLNGNSERAPESLSTMTARVNSPELFSRPRSSSSKLFQTDDLGRHS